MTYMHGSNQFKKFKQMLVVVLCKKGRLLFLAICNLIAEVVLILMPHMVTYQCVWVHLNKWGWVILIVRINALDSLINIWIKIHPSIHSRFPVRTPCYLQITPRQSVISSLWSILDIEQLLWTYLGRDFLLTSLCIYKVLCI